MGANQSFDITTGCDLQEVDNAINQAQKELQQRFDFRNVVFEIEFKRKENKIILSAPDEHKVKAVWDVVQSKMVRRNVPLRNLKLGDIELAAGSSVRQSVELQQSISTEVAKEIVQYIKDNKLKKVQASIQQDQVRVTSPSRDALQEVMQILKQHDFGIELSYGNFRST